MAKTDQEILDDFQRRLDMVRRKRYDIWRCKCGSCGGLIETFWGKNGEGLMNGDYVACGDIILHTRCFEEYSDAFQKALAEITQDVFDFSDQVKGWVITEKELDDLGRKIDNIRWATEGLGQQMVYTHEGWKAI